MRFPVPALPKSLLLTLVATPKSVATPKIAPKKFGNVDFSTIFIQ